MWTVLIAHHDGAFAEQLSAELRIAGYRIIDCSGPWPPAERCIRCDKGYCPLTESADLMIYDPRMTAVDTTGRRHNLAIDSAQAHPEVPMLLAWPPDQVPDAGTLRAIRVEAPNVHVAATTPEGRSRQVHELITAAHTAEALL